MEGTLSSIKSRMDLRYYAPPPNSQLVIFEFAESENAIKPRFIDGREIPDWEKGPDMTEYMRKMAGQGWVVHTAKGARAALFTRPQTDVKTRAKQFPSRRKSARR